MKGYYLFPFALVLVFSLKISSMQAQDRALWGSINTTQNASLGDYQQYNNKLLLSWRMLPDDSLTTSFDIYQSLDGGATEKRVNTTAIQASNYTISSFSKNSDISFRLTYRDDDKTIGSYTISKEQLSGGLPYLTISLKGTDDVCALPEISYQANDMSVGDLDGDGQMEIVIKRLQILWNATGDTIINDGTGASQSYKAAPHVVIWDAYKLDGTLLWRIKSGPSIILGNSSNFAVADLDGDGMAEFITKTGEGTVFGDGTEIGDTNNDGITDYRTWTGGWVDHYNSAGPEFFSVVEGATGKELARANFIDRYSSDSWGDDYWKRANSLRLGVASFSGDHLSVFLGRGVYERSILEGWDYSNGTLTRRFHFDTSNANNNNNKDGKPNSAYAGQGNHSFNVADLDGDGRDEVMYGSMALDDDGNGLWATGLGHGDANHVGKFLPKREGLQVYHCLEGGKTNVALHDAATGETIWSNVSTTDTDCGRCLVADIDPASPGCEFWWYGSNAQSQDGKADLGYKPASCNMAIWFDGTLSRQLIDKSIIHSPANGRTFTMYRFDESFNNGSKYNPGWYGDMLGDWREEVILPDNTKLNNIKIFSTWYPTSHKFPWLMTDHTYLMSAINENVGYNQPTHTGYYIGTDLANDEEAWAAGGYTTKNTSGTTAIKQKPTTSRLQVRGERLYNPAESEVTIYNVAGRRLFVSKDVNINLSGLVNGVYIASNKIESVKIVKRK